MTKRQQIEAAIAELRIIEVDGHWFGVGTAEEVAELRRDGFVPIEATDRAMTMADYA